MAAIEGFWRASELSIRNGAEAAVELARTMGYRSLAMPVFGSGAGGFAVEAALAIIVAAVSEIADGMDVRAVRWRQG